MTQISFALNDESKLKMILNWLKNQDAVHDIVTEPNTLTDKQLEMKNDLTAALQEVELHQQGKITLKTWEELKVELEND